MICGVLSRHQGTILENVAVGLTGTANELKLDRSNEAEVERRCVEALDKAQALAFVKKLPEGIRTTVSGGRTGVLSGGQRQRGESSGPLASSRPRADIFLLFTSRCSCRRSCARSPAGDPHSGRGRVLSHLGWCGQRSSCSLIGSRNSGTSALDSQTEQRLQRAIEAEQAARGMTVMCVPVPSPPHPPMRSSPEFSPPILQPHCTPPVDRPQRFTHRRPRERPQARRRDAR